MQHARNSPSCLHGEAQADGVRRCFALIITSMPFLRLS
jgi:hypothetical protein